MADMDVVVVGDIVCDDWRYVAASAHNPENAVLCLKSRPRSELVLPGGAGLTALCLQQLGAKVTLFGQVDRQPHSTKILTVLQEAGVNIEHVVRDEHWYTPVKTRYINSDDHILVRHDAEGVPAGFMPPTPDFDIDTFDLLAADSACVVVSDYDKGYLTGKRYSVIRAACQHRVPTFVDCKEHCIEEFSRATVLKINQKTAESFSKRVYEQIEADLCRAVHHHAYPTLTVITRGADGVCWRMKDKTRCARFAKHYPAGNAVGAGDAFLAGLVVAFLTSGASFDRHASSVPVMLELAHIAANQKICSPAAELSWANVVAKYFTTDEFRREPENKILPHNFFTAFSRACVNAGRRVVFTNGCFDVLHAGHMHLLQQAKAKGDILVVAVDSDENVQRLKGPDRPVQDEYTRANLLAAMQIVDAVTIFTDNEHNDTLRELVAKCKPHWLVKGGDYMPRECVGWEEVVNRPNPGQVFCCPLLPDVSTTAIIEKFRR